MNLAEQYRPTKSIFVPGARGNVRIGDYVKGLRLAKANPGATFKHGLNDVWPCTGAEIVAQWWRVATDRINHGRRMLAAQFVSDPPVTRKRTREYQIALYRDANRLRDIANRIRVYQFETKEMTARFGHLLAKHDDGRSVEGGAE